jgi:hypothetical protein
MPEYLENGSKPMIFVWPNIIFSGTRKTYQLSLLYRRRTPPTQKFWEFSTHRVHSFGVVPETHVIAILRVPGTKGHGTNSFGAPTVPPHPESVFTGSLVVTTRSEMAQVR